MTAQTEEVPALDQSTAAQLAKALDAHEPTVLDELREALAGHEESAAHVHRDPTAEDVEWLPDWFMKTLGRIDDEEARIKKAHKARIATLKAERASLLWKWGTRFKAAVLASVPPGKKMLTTAYGRAGNRKAKPAIVVEDEDQAVAWCLKFADGHADLATAIDTTIGRTTPILEWIELYGRQVDDDTGEESVLVPAGCKFHDHRDQFLPKLHVDEQLEEALRAAGAEAAEECVNAAKGGES